MQRNAPTIAALLVACAPLAHAGSCNQATLPYELVEIDGMPTTFIARGINNAGQVSGVIPPSTLFRWQDGSATTFEVPGVSLSADAFSQSGLLAGTYFEPQEEDGGFVQRSFIWDPDAGTFDIVDSGTTIFPAAINDSGAIAGLADDKYGFVFNDEGLTPLVLDGIPEVNVGASGGRGINNAGAVVGCDVVMEGPSYFERPFIWTSDTGIVELPSSELGGCAIGINDAGMIAGVVNDGISGNQLATWEPDGTGPNVIGVPIGYFVVSRFAGINNEGVIAFDVPNDFFGFTRSYLWDGNCFIDLTESIVKGPPANIVNAWGINDQGEVLVLAEMLTGNTFMIARPFTPVPVVPGDFDGDGDVDSQDLNTLLADFGCTADCDADINDDGKVDSADLNILLANFGA